MAQKPEAPRAPIELSQAEINALGAGRRDAMRAWSRRLRLTTPSETPATGLRTEKLVPAPIERSELRALAAGKSMPEAVKKRLDEAGRKARAIEEREAMVRKEDRERPTKRPPE
jgi:hypothetical protein